MGSRGGSCYAPPVLDERHAERVLVGGRAGRGPSLSLVEPPRTAVAGGSEEAHRLKALRARFAYRGAEELR